MIYNKYLRYGLILSSILFISLISGCTTTTTSPTSTGRYSQSQDSAPTKPPKNLADIPNAVPVAQPLSQYGNKPTYNVLGKTYHVLPSSRGYDEKGIASWYGTKFDGHSTSNGERYSLYGMSAASKVLPLPTYVQVTNLKNGRRVVVKVNDRGPFHENRIIDLSYAAAYKLDMLSTGTALVEVKALNPGEHINKGVTHVWTRKPTMYLQVAALSNQVNAENLAQRLRLTLKEAVVIRKAGTTAQPIYRVQVGPLSDVSLSDSLYRKIEREHLGKPFTVLE